MLNITLNTWIISDTHFGHKNIVKYCNRPKKHNDIMRQNWIELIAEDDTVLHLGDLFMGRKADAISWIDNLPGDKYMIRGNHDKQNLHWYADRGFKLVGEFGRLYWHDAAHRVCFSHYPEDQKLDWGVNIHGHIHNNGYAPVWIDAEITET